MHFSLAIEKMDAESTSLKDASIFNTHRPSPSPMPFSKEIDAQTLVHQKPSSADFILLLLKIPISTACMLFGQIVMDNYEVFEGKDNEAKTGNIMVL